MTTGRALESALDALHGFAADALVTELRQHMEQLNLNPQRIAEHDNAVYAYERVMEVWEANGSNPDTKPKEPKPLVLYQVPPQFLDKVLKFLAQNGVNAPATAPKVDALARKLADLDLDAETQRPPH